MVATSIPEHIRIRLVHSMSSYNILYVDTQTCRPALSRRSNQRQEPNRYFARCDRAHCSLIPFPSLVISNGAKIFKTGSLDCQPHFVQAMEVSITHEERAERVRLVFDQAHARSKIPGCSTWTAFASSLGGDTVVDENQRLGRNTRVAVDPVRAACRFTILRSHPP
jgi:hypothetical protein